MGKNNPQQQGASAPTPPAPPAEAPKGQAPPLVEFYYKGSPQVVSLREKDENGKDVDREVPLAPGKVVKMDPRSGYTKSLIARGMLESVEARKRHSERANALRGAAEMERAGASPRADMDGCGSHEAAPERGTNE